MLEILFEDNHCLVVNKPAGLLSQGDETGDISVVDLARDYIKIKYDKPGNVYVGLIHRLDRPTSGVVLLGRTSKGAERLSKQFREGTIAKIYLAVVEGKLTPDSGEWRDRLLKDATRNVVKVVANSHPEGQDAVLEYRVLESDGATSLIELHPKTGRSHQLRVQLASRGFPIVGDAKYGAQRSLKANDGRPRVALHASSLSFQHPTRAETIRVSAPLPSDWPKLPATR